MQPGARNSEETLADIGEQALIARLCPGLPGRADVLVPAGDDCAVVRPFAEASHDWVLTSDPVIEGVHFAPGTDPRGIGHKALGRALSDLAAMGAAPRWALTNLVAPGRTTVGFVEQLADGVAELARCFEMAVVGGDTARGSVLSVHVFAVGEVPTGSALLRSGARAGDSLFVTGGLGGSLAGRHLEFRPRVREGIWLREWASALIDVSDGLAADLPRLTDASRTGARLDLAAVPVADAARQADDGRTGLDHALCDGEDFELLIAVPGARSDAFLSAWRNAFDLPCSRIGELTDQAGVIETIGVDGAVGVLGRGGYEHFNTNA